MFAGILERFSRWMVYAAAVLVPLWFLPFTLNIGGYQKQVLLLLISFLGILAWLGSAINKGELRFKRSWLYLPVGVLVLVVGLSAVFSQWMTVSLWGFPLDIAEGFLTVVALALLFVLVVNVTKDAKDLFLLASVAVFSLAAAVLFSIFQFYGLFLLPFAFAKSAAFNTLGSPGTVALLAASMLPLSLALAFSAKKLLKALLWVAVAIFFLTLILLNTQSSWIVLTVGLLVLLAFGMMSMRKRQSFGWLFSPLLFLAIALFFLVFPIGVPGAPPVPLEVSISQGAEWEIAQGVLKQNPVLGSGPATFQLAYTEHRSPLLNQTIFWGTRFASGASELLDFLVTKGVLGLLALLSLFGFAFFKGVRMLTKNQEENVSWQVSLGALATLASFAAFFVLHPANLVPWFLAWLVLGILAATLVLQKESKVQLAPPSMVALGAFAAFLLFFIFGLGVLFVGAQKYAAEVFYLQGVRAASQGETTEAIGALVRSVQFNPSLDLYWRDLSQLYLARLNEVANDQDLTEEERTPLIQQLIQSSIATAREATNVAPANVENWNVQGYVYRNLIGIEGAEQLAVDAYTEATKREPSSPFSWGEIGRAYIIRAQQLEAGEEQDQLLELALENLQKSVELKSDYAPAHFLMAAAYSQQGKTAEAIQTLQGAVQASPQDVGLGFQLGVLHYQEQQYEEAQTVLERVKTLDPNYANARYMLGLVYEQQGSRDLALAEFEKVAELNPDNEEVKTILGNIEAERPALEGITPSQPPLEETPPEIQEGE